MRFIIREMDYEKPLAAGRLLYARHGQLTGVAEAWRLTAAVDGYRFLRVDLDARESASPESTLYHLTLNPAGRPVRLKFRYFGPNSQVDGDLMFEDDSVTLSRTASGHRFEDERGMKPNYRFWFPSTLGLSLLADLNLDGRNFLSVTINKDEAFTLDLHQVQLKVSQEEQMVSTGQPVSVRPYLICWADFMQTIWLDSYNLPVKHDRGNGLLALESRYVRFRQS